MEDFLKFILIAGVFLVGIINEVKKNKSKKTKSNRPASPRPSTAEVAPDAVPFPNTWGSPKSLDEWLEPQPVEPTAPQRTSSSSRSSQKTSAQHPSKQKKKKEEISVAASLANSAAQDQFNSRQGSHYDALRPSSPDTDEDFTIHSAEEARRAIIWGEILQRKY